MLRALLLSSLLATLPAAAQSPVHHGELTIRPARGRIDRDTGESTLTVKRWFFLPTVDSNGLAPADEPVLIALGESDRFTVEARALKAARNGRTFTYRNPKTQRGVRSLRLQRSKSGVWRVQFQVVGAELSRLTLEYPFCQPLAVIIGDDDGFSGVEIDRPDGFTGSRLKVLAPRGRAASAKNALTVRDRAD
jgi:hypothetical protein